MDKVNALDVIMRWLHIMGAIVTVGGTFFAALVLMPSLRGLQSDILTDLHEGIRSRFSRILMIGIAAMLVSGFYNYISNEMPAHEGNGLYHGLMGGKILLAFFVFFIGSALVGRSPALEAIRRRRKRWMAVNLLMAAIIVVLGAILRAM